MGSLHDRCSVHPQRRVVGICANCLHERLTLLIESISPEDVLDGQDVAGGAHNRQISNEEQKRLPPPRPHRVSHERSASSFNPYTKTSTEMALHSHAKLEDSLSLALQKVKHAHQQLSYHVSQSPYQVAVKLGPSASPLMPSSASEKNVSMPASRRRSNASEADMKMFPGSTDPLGKRRGSWFSISRGKNSLVNSPLPPNAGKLDDKNCLEKSPQIKILAGRKSASDAIGGSCNSYRQAYMADLESIAEINLGEAAIKVEPNESIGDVHSNPSWISSLFHRRKGSRYKSYERQDAGVNNSVADANAVPSLAEASVNRSPMPAFEAGRLSWDGPRPSFKQILKRIEARKKQQRVDCSPMHNLATSADQSKECLEDALMGQASSLQKCKSVASSRRNISVEMPKNSGREAVLSPVLLNNANVQVEYSNGDITDKESRRWGRAWNRTLSPLLGFRNARKSAHDSNHQHPGYATPNHVNFKSPLGAPPSSSSYMSSLSRGEYASDAQIQFAQ